MEVLGVCDIRNVDQLRTEIAARLGSSSGEIDRVIDLFEQHVGPDKLVNRPGYSGG